MHVPQYSRALSACFASCLVATPQTVAPTERGDVLIFVSGVWEITAVASKLATYASENKRWIVLTLHSGLPGARLDALASRPAK